jgi:HEAT repeat protein
MGRVEAVKPLFEALNDSVHEVAAQSMTALIKMGDVAVYALLTLLPESDSPDQRVLLVRILGEIATPRAISALMQTALDETEHAWVRQEARDILNRLGYDPHTPA